MDPVIPLRKVVAYGRAWAAGLRDMETNETKTDNNRATLSASRSASAGLSPDAPFRLPESILTVTTARGLYARALRNFTMSTAGPSPLSVASLQLG